MSHWIFNPPDLPPVHAGPTDPRPHVTVRDYDQQCTYHVPYVGQTTLNMYKPFGNGETFEHINKHQLGTLDHDNATFTPWLGKK